MQGIFSSPNQYIGWDHINRFNPAKTLCMSQARTWISNIVCRGLFCIQWVQMRDDCCWGERWLLLRWEMIVVEVRDDCCWGERWLLLRWEMIVVEVRDDCCWGERWLLLRWEMIVVEVRGDCCWGERWLLLRWEVIVVEVRGDCCWGERWLLLRWEMIVCFVDIGGIVYRHCFNFFHNYNEIQIYHPSFRLWEVSLIIMKSRYIIHRSDYEKYH